MHDCPVCGTRHSDWKCLAPEIELTPIIPDDGYADGGEPYTDEELAIINNED